MVALVTRASRIRRIGRIYRPTLTARSPDLSWIPSAWLWWVAEKYLLPPIRLVRCTYYIQTQMITYSPDYPWGDLPQGATVVDVGGGVG